MTLAMMVVKRSVAHTGQKWRVRGRAEDIGTARFIDFHSHKRYHGTHVWRQQSCREVDQWDLCDGRNVSGINWTNSEDTAFVVEEESCLSSGTGR